MLPDIQMQVLQWVAGRGWERYIIYWEEAMWLRRKFTRKGNEIRICVV